MHENATWRGGASQPITLFQYSIGDADALAREYDVGRIAAFNTPLEMQKRPLFGRLRDNVCFQYSIGDAGDGGVGAEQ